jgi:hypothetical protein
MTKQPPPTNADRRSARGIADETFARTMAAFATVFERITPWLLDLGSWIFGAVIAFNLVILGALLTVGPVDPSVLVATAGFALALPLDAAGFGVLRLAVDMKNVALEEITTTAFQVAGFEIEKRAPTPTEATEKRRMMVVLRYAYIFLALAIVLSLVGMTAALWHMAWWIAVMFVAMVVVSQGLGFRAIASGGSNAA